MSGKLQEEAAAWGTAADAGQPPKHRWGWMVRASEAVAPSLQAQQGGSARGWQRINQANDRSQGRYPLPCQLVRL